MLNAPTQMHDAVSMVYQIMTYLNNSFTVKILKFGTPQTIAIIVLKIEKIDVTLH